MYSLNVNEPILVGGKKFITIATQELQNILSHGCLPTEGSDTAAISCRSLLKCMQSKTTGMLFRIGEHILVATDTDTQVMEVTDFFAIHHTNGYHTFVKGKIFAPFQNLRHLYSGNIVVVPTSETMYIPAKNILRKVMLYPGDDIDLPSKTKYVLVDFLRPSLDMIAEDVNVPVYPEFGDMVKVCGDNNEVWYVHIRTVDTRTKTCKVHFYVEDANCSGKYHRETFIRRYIEILHWDSILGLAAGYWSGNFWYSS